MCVKSLAQTALVAAVTTLLVGCTAPPTTITLRKTLDQYRNDLATNVVAHFEDLGFTDVSTEEVENTRGTKYNNTVENITIGGESDLPILSEVSSDDPVVVQYRGVYQTETITLPKGADAYVGKPVQEVEDELTSLGFKDVKKAALVNDQGHDVDQQVTAVTIKGAGDFKSGSSFKDEDAVIIQYYQTFNDEAANSTNSTNSTNSKRKVESPSTKVATSDVWPGTEYSYVIEDSRSGYVIKATMRFGKWIRANDTENLNKAWKAAGGEGSAPDISQYSPQKASVDAYQADKGAMTFFTLEFDNLTEGYDLSADNSIGVSLYEIAELEDYIDWNEIAYLDSGTYQCGPGKGMTSPIVSLKSNHWGPVVMGIAATDIFLPKYGTEGNPDFYSSYLELGSWQIREPIRVDLPFLWRE